VRPSLTTFPLLLIVTASFLVSGSTWAQSSAPAQTMAVATSAAPAPSSAAAPGSAAAMRPTPTTDEILQKYRSALGGEEIWSSITTRTLKGIYQTEDLSGFAGIEILSKAPNMSFSKITFPNGVTVHEVCDGRSAWLEDTVGGMHEFTGAALQSRIMEASFRNRADILAKMSPGRVIGTAQVGAHSTYVVAFSPEKKVSSKIYFDQETGFAVRADDVFHRDDGDYAVETDLDDYRPVDGAYYPFKIRHVERGNVFTIRVTQIKNNVPVDATVFVRPGSPANVQ
jgi:hypothetical protein